MPGEVKDPTRGKQTDPMKKGETLKACLHERFSAYLSPDTVTTADSNPTPETTSRRLSAEVEHVPMFANK